MSICHHQRDQDARQDAGHEQFRDRLLGGGAEQDHRDAGRDQDVDRAARTDEPGRKALAVSVTDEARIERLPHRGDGRNARAGNRADQGRGTDGRDAERSRHAPDQGQHPDDQPVGDPGRAHQFAGEDEERNGEQRVILEPAEHDLMDRDRRYRQERYESQDRAGQ
jgi:hypothetical protein